MFCIRFNRNMKCAVCFMLKNNRLCIFQWTVSAHHPVKGSGLMRIINQLRVPNSFWANVHLVFATTEKGVNTLQPLTVSPGESKTKNYAIFTAIPTLWRHYRHYRIVVMPVHAVVTCFCFFYCSLKVF
jgi:hypothetical protein